MILETGQLLCSAKHILPSPDTPPYKLTHKNHPCSIWTRSHKNNYLWLCDHGLALCKEYTYRYNKRHKTQNVIESCMNNLPLFDNKKIPQLQFDKFDITIPPLAMPEEYKSKSIIESYRKYYNSKQDSFSMRWSKRKDPDWFSFT